MKLSGLQKLTLLDYPGHIACTVFTAGCNFRCPFCHNAGLVLPERERDEFDEEYILSFLKKRIGVLDGVAITGGEPLIHADIADFLARIKAMGYMIKLDHNGTQPDRLIYLVENGLVDRVAMDIKNSPAQYAATAGLEKVDMAAIERSKDYLLSGKVEYEFRTTVVKGIHTKQSLIEAAKWISGAKEYYLQQFKDSGDILDISGIGAYSDDEMRALLSAVREYLPEARLRGV